MSLPSAWVERIFEKLAIVYGRDFLSRWEGLNLNDVKTDWSHELSGFFTHPSSIAWALDNLPERAPSVVEFRNLARKAPMPELPQLEVSKAGMERVKAELAKLEPTRAAMTKRVDGKQWARDLIARHKAGEVSRSSLPLTMAKAALAESTTFTPVVDDREAA